MRGHARVSIVVPIYNVADHVRDCIASIASQSFGDFETILVDDGSTDGSGDIAQAVAENDPRFVVLRQSNGGLSAARNAGLRRARGEFLAFVDSDDRLAPGFLTEMVRALDRSGADWVSCAIKFCPKDSEAWAHSGMHGRWKLEDGAEPERHGLDTWGDVVQHFPSVWNKLYRRSLAEGIRFDEGMNYEDHAYFWRYAARTDHLLRLPNPLYLSTQGRDGQITRDGSERVFEQFKVLDILEKITQQGSKAGPEVALAQMATRLSFERAEAIRDPDRRARFVAQARDWLQRRMYAPDPALAVPAYWQEVLQGAVPVSVVVPTNGAPEALQSTLESLAKRSLQEAEILVVPDEAACRPESDAHAEVCRITTECPGASVLSGAVGVAGARNRGLEGGKGQTIVFLDAGDQLKPGALARWHSGLRRADAQLACAPMRMGEAGDTHPGLHDRMAIAPERLSAPEGSAATPQDALILHAHPSAKIFDRNWLVKEVIQFPPGALSSTHFLARVVLRAARILWLGGPPVQISTRPDCRRLWRAPVAADKIRAAVAAMADDPALARLPEHWQARIWARAVWEKLNFADFGDAEATRHFAADVAQISGSIPGLTPDVALDPFIGGRVRALLGLPAN